MSIFETLKNVLTGGDNNNETSNPDNILPASQDPLGDPADQQAVNQQDGDQNVLPASQDPLGDPADEENNSGSREGEPLLGGIFRRTR